MGKILQRLKGKTLLYGVIIPLFALFGVILAFSYQQFQEKKAENILKDLQIILNSKDYSKNNCEKILNFSNLRVKNLPNFNQNSFSAFYTNCENRFDISKRELSLNFCQEIIRNEKNYFSAEFINLNNFSEVQKSCILEFSNLSFQTIFTNHPDFDGKTLIYANFNIPFSENNSEENSNLAKEKFLSVFQLKDEDGNIIKIDEKNILFGDLDAFLILKLENNKKYFLNAENLEGNNLLTFENVENTFGDFQNNSLIFEDFSEENIRNLIENYLK